MAGKEARELVKLVVEDEEVQRRCLSFLSEVWNKVFS